MYYEWYQQNKKIIIATVVCFILVLFAWGAWISISRAGKVAITVSTVPRDSSISIDGQPSGSGTLWLKPGKYVFKAQKDGFKTREKTITVTDEKEQNVVALALSPESEQAKKWADEHAGEYKNNETYGAVEAQANGQYFRDNNPIVAHLPYNDPYYQITYASEADNSIVLTINTPSPRYRYFAIQKIRELGYDPSDFNIIFSDFKNPLE